MRYNRTAAVEYAHRWAFSRNSAFSDFSLLGGDCTNFASQCIYAGSGVMNYTPVTGWYYVSLNRRAPAWTGVNELYKFLVNNRNTGPQARLCRLDEIENGDIIQLRFVGMDTFSHCPVVVDKGDGTPDTILVAAHSLDSDNRPLSSYAYEELRPVNIFNVG